MIVKRFYMIGYTRKKVGRRDVLLCPCAGINPHVVGNDRVLQERSSEPPGLESCGGGREAVIEA